MAKKSHYETLGIAKDAPAEEVRKAHRRKAKKVHPDAGGDKELFSLVQRAYETLIDSGGAANTTRPETTPNRDRTNRTSFNRYWRSQYWRRYRLLSRAE